MNLKSSFFL